MISGPHYVVLTADRGKIGFTFFINFGERFFFQTWREHKIEQPKFCENVNPFSKNKNIAIVHNSTAVLQRTKGPS